jgi:hypothetical protein
VPLRQHRCIDVEIDFAEETASAYRRERYRFLDVDVILARWRAPRRAFHRRILCVRMKPSTSPRNACTFNLTRRSHRPTPFCTMTARSSPAHAIGRGRTSASRKSRVSRAAGALHLATQLAQHPGEGGNAYACPNLPGGAPSLPSSMSGAGSPIFRGRVAQRGG